MSVQSGVVPLGPFNLVYVYTKVGMVCCGAFDVFAMEKFSYPAATIKSVHGKPIITIEDLLAGEVKNINSFAERLGVKPGMSGKEALEKLS